MVPRIDAQQRRLRRWLIGFAMLVVAMVLVGGFVRLTRSGLSIVEWNPISGAIPPLTYQAWLEEFAKYQQTPEYQKVNRSMTLDQYQYIFWIEWIHRQLARGIGLYFAVPALWWLMRRRIPVQRRGKIVTIGILFIAQAIMGWLMVASGLVDQPAVSHFRLTAHLLLALAMLALTVWVVLDMSLAEDRAMKRWNPAVRSVAIALAVLVVQIAYGGMTAGLKAGHVSDTWPLMLGELVPSGMLSVVEPAWLNLLETPVAVMFVHRWLPFIALLGVPLLWRSVRWWCGYDRRTSRLLTLFVVLVILQIVLGISVVVLHVTLPVALLHQAGAIALLVVLIAMTHHCAVRGLCPEHAEQLVPRVAK